MDLLTDHLAEARAAHRRGEWSASYAAFARADGVGPMSLDDVESFAIAAWRIGHANEAVRLSERVYDRMVRTDPVAASMAALYVALQWLTRGDVNIGGGWADRARRLIAGSAFSPTHGYPDWARRLGFSPTRLDAADRAAIELAEQVRSKATSKGTAAVVSGCIGPREQPMSAAEAQRYHSVQIASFDHDGPWLERVVGLRLNASTRSHAELDEAEQLDEGDPDDFGAGTAALRERLPSATVLGGCCGTDARHVAAVWRELAPH